MNAVRLFPGDFDRLFHDGIHSTLVDFTHSEITNAALSQNFLFLRIQNANSNQGDSLGIQIHSTSADLDELGMAHSESYGERHSVDVSREARLRSVEIG